MSKGFSQVTKNATISMLTGGGEGDVCSILNKRNRAVITSPSTPPPTAAEWSAEDSLDNEPLSKVLRLAPGQLPPPSPSIPIGVEASQQGGRGAVAKPKPASPVKAARIAIPDPPMSAKERQAHEAQKRKDDRARELQKKKDEATKRKEAQASVRAARTMNS